MIRKEQLEEEFKRKIGDIISNDLNDPRLDMVSILGVRLSDDKSVANVYFSILEDKDRDKIIECVEKATGMIRKILSKRVHLRYLPKLVFIVDTSISYSLYIDKKIDEVCKRKDDDE